jgi:hypothetical protein
MNKERVSMIATHTVGTLTFIMLAVVADRAARWWATLHPLGVSTSPGFPPVDQMAFWWVVGGLGAAGAGAWVLAWSLRDCDLLRARIAIFTAIAAWIGAIITVTAAFVAVRSDHLLVTAADMLRSCPGVSA